MTTRQCVTESVDDYSLRFQRLLRRVNTDPANPVVPANLQVRMYLFGLSPVLTPLVSTDNPGNLNDAIERARLVENGYNYTPIKTNNDQETEIEKLTKKIENLTLHYTDVASVLAAQANQNNRSQGKRTRTFNNFSRNRNNNNPSGSGRRDDRICYNCNRQGHIAQNCSQPRRTPRGNRRISNTTRDVHYMDLSEQGEYEEGYAEDKYEDEAEVYQYEQEIYPVIRSGRNYIPTTSFKTTPIVDELDELQRNTLQNSRISEGVSNNTITKSNKRKMIPAPIETLTEFDIAAYL
jgi:hypothetical protein